MYTIYLELLLVEDHLSPSAVVLTAEARGRRWIEWRGRLHVVLVERRATPDYLGPIDQLRNLLLLVLRRTQLLPPRFLVLLLLLRGQEDFLTHHGALQFLLVLVRAGYEARGVSLLSFVYFVSGLVRLRISLLFIGLVVNDALLLLTRRQPVRQAVSVEGFASSLGRHEDCLEDL